MKTTGPAYWRTLEEYAQTEEFRAWAEREFPAVAFELTQGTATSRRSFLKLMGAAMALAGLPGCGQRPKYEVVPYRKKPVEVTPGVPLYYATTLELDGKPIGVLAETHEGRPTKLEGNPDHPNSGGALPAWAQASILDLYDPDRSRTPTKDGKPVDWEKDVLPMLAAIRTRHKKDEGQGLAIVAEPSSSPALAMLRDELREKFPKIRWVQGETSATEYDLAGAKVIVSLDADVLGSEDEGVRHQRAFGAGRDPKNMNRLYAVEPHLTVTGMAADHRIVKRPSEIPEFAQQLLAQVRSDAPTDPVAKDLKQAGPNGVVVVGRRLGDLGEAQQINEALGSKHVRHFERATSDATPPEALAKLLASGAVRTLIVLGENPAYSSPELAAAMRNAPNRVHVGVYADETAAASTWHVPMAHPLESWGDAQTGDVLSAVQPMIDPLFGGKSALEVLALLLGREKTSAYEIARESFAKRTSKSDGASWNAHLNRGLTKVASERMLSVRAWPEPLIQDPSSLDVCFAVGPIHAGRFANNGWLQELPDPVTKLTWDNAAWLAPKTAKGLDVTTGDVVQITVGDASIEIPAIVVPGTAEKTIVIPLGYGRTRAGALGTGIGVDATPIAGASGAVSIKKTGRTVKLATSQEHWSIASHETVDGALQDRGIVREASLQHFEKQPDFAEHMGIHSPPLQDIYETPDYTGEHQWAMAVDMTRCTGCSACVVACQAENNIPIVGKDEVLNGREMHWLRIDRYYRGDDPAGDVTVSNQPMMCQHCESAPCEPVCPVNATVHDEDGLNVMAYNRCVGTRYCSNNCPYKVRRFNYYDYNKDTLRQSKEPFDGSTGPDPTEGFGEPQVFQEEQTVLQGMQHNPDVTVRMRGVMEKCTFCVQRIQRAKIDKKVAAGQSKAAKVTDADLQVACQQSCPTQAILFGDLTQPESAVAKARKDPRSYAVLGNLNTRPRTTYLARIRNLNPEMPTAHEDPPMHDGSHGAHTTEHEGGAK